MVPVKIGFFFSRSYLLPHTSVSLSVRTGLSICVTIMAHSSMQASILSLFAGLFMRPLTLPGRDEERERDENTVWVYVGVCMCELIPHIKSMVFHHLLLIVHPSNRNSPLLS